MDMNINHPPPSDIPSPAPVGAVERLLSRRSGPLGFGTGLLHQVDDPASAVRLLRQAHEQGITYFDTARLYGEGRCEGLLGEAFAPIRGEVILATKVGILPPARDLAIRLKGKLAATLRRLPPLRGIVPPPAIRWPEFGVFDPARMQVSLETSLRELRTDHVDLLLLHECTLEDVRRAEVLDFAEQIVRQGKARAWGVAPAPDAMLAIAASGTPYGEVAQFDAALRPAFARPPALTITHSCLGTRFQETLSRLSHDAQLKDRWSGALGRVATPANVAQGFLAHAIWQNPTGLVLFSTTRPERLRPNLDAATLITMPDQAAAIAALIAAE
ncbi:aldo/keto reductase [Hyphomonas sp. NPDC076900]|uniref:aldo/keto reductase n=1 Tax=unclassified Hyphomonas TaxID=2630699 RepID=UPI003D06145D